MSSISVLDCTLRDGGYCNNWDFGRDNIKKIIEHLSTARVDIIECGFLTNKITFSYNKSKFNSIEQIEDCIPNSSQSMYVLMINYGEYNIDDIPFSKDTKIDGIRVVFHKNEAIDALLFCKKIIDKGYKCFVQPMLSQSYNDEEFINLIKEANKLSPYSFYIVDSFGTMRNVDLLHYLILSDTFLDKSISIGFHSHNNLQLAFSNAKSFIEYPCKRNRIVDCSIYGMGRGAGNLNTELFLNELNSVLRYDNDKSKYLIKPLLSVMDNILGKFYEHKPWGYSLANYLSAIQMIHPNYANFLYEKRTLQAQNIDEIFAVMDPVKKISFNKDYISSLYTKYMSRNDNAKDDIESLLKLIDNRKILLIAPGKSLKKFKESIYKFIENTNPIVISINHINKEFKNDFIFISNIRRFKQIENSLNLKVIKTSNIEYDGESFTINYSKLINDNELVQDNAGLMAISLVLNFLNKNSVFIAGMDGYSHEENENYEFEEFSYKASNEYYDKLNNSMYEVINNYRGKLNFITPSLFCK